MNHTLEEIVHNWITFMVLWCFVGVCVCGGGHSQSLTVYRPLHMKKERIEIENLIYKIMDRLY